jgi:hypothetical protein
LSKTKTAAIVQVILMIVGGFAVLSWGTNITLSIFDEDYRRDKQQEEYEANMGKAYQLGMLWGEQVASEYDAEAWDNYQFETIDSNNKARSIAKELLDSRYIDFACWGADNCMDLPTEEQLLEWYSTEAYPVGNMPVHAFKSGYIDAFVSYFEW